MLDGTETGITVSYDDTDGNLDFVVADSDFALTGDVTGAQLRLQKVMYQSQQQSGIVSCIRNRYNR